MNPNPKTYFDYVFNSIEELKDEAIVEQKEGAFTLGQIDSMASKVRAFIKEHGLSSEDTVLLLLPRGYKTLASILGVLKCGVAFVPLEEGYPEDRVEYIKNDCNPKLVIDSHEFERIMEYPEDNGYDKANPHDLCFIIYTSGSTGKPKGVMHEYGDLDFHVAVNELTYGELYPDYTLNQIIHYMRTYMNNIVTSPPYFIAGLNYYFDSFLFGTKRYFLSAEEFNDVNTFKKLLLDRKITSTFLTPSYLKQFDDIKTPYLTEIWCGAERITDLLRPGITIFNAYGMSESIDGVSYFRIDKQYDITPVGKPYSYLRAQIVDEAGNQVQPGEMGELIFWNPYFRGYKNLPEQTAAAKKGEMFYTGDIAKELPDGNFVVLGRKDDMIKVNGNRVEPAEIEKAIKDALNISWAHVQAFDLRGRTIICAYYLDDIEFDVDELKAALGKCLPSYMIPSHYEKIDSVPLLMSGKIDRMAFTAPELEMLQAEYIEPVTDTEKFLCKAFEEVLGIKPIGLKDEFATLGGDSLAAMQIVAKCGLPGFDVHHIVKYKNVEQLSVCFDEIRARNNKSLDERNRENMDKPWPLFPHQLLFLNQQMSCPGSMEYNLSSLIKISRLANENKIKRALEQTIRNHPAFFTIIKQDESGHYYQCFDASIEKNIEIEHISDKEMLQIKDSLPKAFNMINSRLYDCRIFVSTLYIYVFFDVHHIISDGTSLNLFVKDLLKAYKSEPLDPDYYYVCLEEYVLAMETEDLESSRHFYEERYKDFRIPKIYKGHPQELGREILQTTKIDTPREHLNALMKKYALSSAELYMGVLGLAIADVTKEKQFGFGWTYSGRDSILKNNSCACYITQLMTYVDLDKTLSLESYYEDIKDQVKENIKNVLCPYAFDILPSYPGGMTYIYQGDLFSQLSSSDIQSIPLENDKNASDSFLQFNILEEIDGVSVLVNYNTAYFDSELINSIIEAFRTIIESRL